jgi:hypothetical protein
MDLVPLQHAPRSWKRIIEVGYAKRQKKAILPTEKGTHFIALVPDALTSAELTGKWEYGFECHRRSEGGSGCVHRRFMTVVDQIYCRYWCECESMMNEQRFPIGRTPTWTSTKESTSRPPLESPAHYAVKARLPRTRGLLGALIGNKAVLLHCGKMRWFGMAGQSSIGKSSRHCCETVKCEGELGRLC